MALSGLGVDEGSLGFSPGIFLGATFFDEILPFPVEGDSSAIICGVIGGFVHQEW